MDSNLAARAGRWSAQNRKKAFFGWLLFVIAAVAIGSAIGTKNLDSAESGVGSSGRADKTMSEAFPKDADETVLVQSKSQEAGDPQFKAAVADVTRRLEKVRHVSDVESGPVSKDRHSALVSFKLAGDEEQVAERVTPALAAVGAADKANAGFRIEEFGDASADKALSESYEEDFKTAETISLPITLVILVVAFGALVAAGIPLLLALSAVAATIGLVGPMSQVLPVDESISSVILLIGLAVGVDYSLFYLRREREERARGLGERAALEAAAATSGRAVLISGLTVMIAMAGMYLAGAATFQSFATGTIMVVAIAVIGSLTVLPAVLSKLGDRVDKGRIPFLSRRRSEGRIWGAVVDRVLARPVVSLVVAGGLLVALAVPTLGMDTRLPGIDTLPRDLEVVQTYDRIQAAFPGDQVPAEVVLSNPDRADIAEIEKAVASRPEQFVGPVTTEFSPDRSVAVVSVPIAGDGTNEKSVAALQTLRGEIVPPGADVAGITASTEDFNEAMNSNIVWVFAFVLSAAFALLLVTFRSVVIPLKAIALNLLSVGAAYGLLVLIFQPEHAITAWLPLFLFVVLFGLSMDYHVFILTRIREAVDRGMSTEEAVRHGIKTTAGVVTSAAVVMVGVFATFATLSAIEMKQMGVGLAAAVLIDATIIRGVLLPASMKLLGEWNWWLPSWLHWLPRVSHEGEPAPART